jgi:hypothetical protein
VGDPVEELVRQDRQLGGLDAGQGVDVDNGVGSSSTPALLPARPESGFSILRIAARTSANNRTSLRMASASSRLAQSA